jgi:hypothetical protein
MLGHFVVGHYRSASEVVCIAQLALTRTKSQISGATSIFYHLSELASL